MITQPFSLFRPFTDHFTVAFFTKEDDVRSDADAASQLGLTDTAGLGQEHKNRAIRIDGPTDRTEKADAVATDRKNLLLCLRAADCQNFVIFEPKRHVIGVMHAGWRGIEAGIIRSFFDLLKTEWGIEPHETYVGAGPSLCQTCAEFTDPARELPSVPSSCIDGRHVDLQKAADLQLQSLGVLPERMERSPDCTKCRADLYWSYRGGDREAVMEGHTNVLCCVLAKETNESKESKEAKEK